jgi:hypothetical protein
MPQKKMPKPIALVESYHEIGAASVNFCGDGHPATGTKRSSQNHRIRRLIHGLHGPAIIKK